MTAEAASADLSTRAAFSPGRIVMAGVAGGALDFVYASSMTLARGRPFASIWQFVASSWLGEAGANLPGAVTASLGILTHFLLSICMAAVYAAAATRIRILYGRPRVMGVLYGLLLYVFMFRVVLPLRWPERFPRWDGVRSLMEIGSHMGVGLVIASVLAYGWRSERRR